MLLINHESGAKKKPELAWQHLGSKNEFQFAAGKPCLRLRFVLSGELRDQNESEVVI